MASLILRWVEEDDPRPRPGPRPIGIPLDVVDSLTIIVGVSRVVEERWSELSDSNRKELATMLRRRAHHLLAILSQSEPRGARSAPQ